MIVHFPIADFVRFAVELVCVGSYNYQPTCFVYVCDFYGAHDIVADCSHGFIDNLQLGGPTPIGARKAPLSEKYLSMMQEVALNEQVSLSILHHKLLLLQYGLCLALALYVAAHWSGMYTFCVTLACLCHVEQCRSSFCCHSNCMRVSSCLTSCDTHKVVRTGSCADDQTFWQCQPLPSH